MRSVGLRLLAACALAACSQQPAAVGEANQVVAPAADAPDAASPTPTKPPANAVTSAPAPAATVGLGAVNVFVDPVTGEMREPTAREVAVIAASRSTVDNSKAVKQAELPEEVQLPGGGTMVRLGDRGRVEEHLCVDAANKTVPCPVPTRK
jgi:hypothetical protein